MNRRIAAFLLALMMALGAPLALAEMTGDEKIAAITEVVKAYIKEEGYNFDHDDEDDIFTGSFELDSTLGSCDVKVYVYDDMLAVSASPSLKVPAKYRDNMAVFLTLANYDEYYSQFRMDYEDGYLNARSAQVIENVIPTTKEVETLMMMAILTLDDYGNGINKVALGLDPQEVYIETRQAIDGPATDKSL